jgi:hypothetical protein
VVDLASVRIPLAALAGWLNRRQQEALAYLLAENRVLRRQLRGRRLRLTDDERRRLAVCGHRQRRHGVGGGPRAGGSRLACGPAEGSLVRPRAQNTSQVLDARPGGQPTLAVDVRAGERLRCAKGYR